MCYIRKKINCLFFKVWLVKCCFHFSFCFVLVSGCDLLSVAVVVQMRKIKNHNYPIRNKKKSAKTAKSIWGLFCGLLAVAVAVAVAIAVRKMLRISGHGCEQLYIFGKLGKFYNHLPHRKTV